MKTKKTLNEMFEAVVGYNPKLSETPEPILDSNILEIYTPPFKYNGIYLIDSKGNIVADFAPLSRTFRKKHKNALEIHRAMGNAIADFLNTKYKPNT